MGSLLAKLQWLRHSAGFRRDPFGVMARVLAWEWFRFRGKEISYQFDQSFSVRLRPNEGVSRLTYYFGTSEPELFSFYDSFLRNGMTVLDVGANIGFHSLFMAKRVGPFGRVFSLEPSPQNFKRLEAHLAENRLKNIRALPIALGNAPGEAYMEENIYDSSRSRLTREGAGVPVKMNRLDDFLKAEGLGKVDFCKLDVEGFELKVLEGGVAAFSKSFCDVLQIELDPNNLAHQGSQETKVASWLARHGYRFVFWDHSTNRFKPAAPGSGFSYNSFFVSPNFTI